LTQTYYLEYFFGEAIRKIVSSGQMSYNGGVRTTKALMYENQMRLFNLKGEINEQAGNFKVF